jgi:hypothetical protein
MQRRHGWIAAAITAALLGLASVAVTGALAGKDLRTKTKTVEVDSQDTGSATAKCKRGTKAVSGGFFGELDISDTSPGVLVEGSFRGRGRTWRADGINLSSTEDGDLVSEAYCRHQKVKSRKGAEESIDGAGGMGTFDTETVTAKCRRGTRLLSGGFESPEFDEVDFTAGSGSVIIPQSSRKVGKRGWEAEGLNLGPDSGDFRAQVNCREGGRNLKTREASEEVDPSPDTEEVEITARCRRSERVISGGFDLESNDPDAIAVFTSSRKAGRRGWNVEGIVGSSTETREVTAFAYCEKKT